MPELWDSLMASPDEQAAASDAFAAAAQRTRRPYQAAIDRPPDNQLGAVADFLAPQTPLDYALMFGGPATRGMSPLLRGAGLGLAAALTPDEAQAGPSGKLWHAISGIKLPRPIEEYFATHSPRAPLTEKRLTPSDLQGKEVYPTISDTTRPETYLTSYGDYKLPEPRAMQGGMRFPAVNDPLVWMSDKGAMTNLSNRVAEIGQKTGRDVVVAPTALNPSGADYSHHVYQTVVDRLNDTKGITKAGRSDFNDIMREIDPKFPGAGADRDRLMAYLDKSPRDVRTTFVQAMDTRRMQDAGFPDISEIRHAVIDPQLLHAPLGSSGPSIFRIDPVAGVKPYDIHGTYSHGATGENLGSLGAIIPPEVMFPDVMKSLELMSKESGKPLNKYTGRPDYYFQGRIPETLESGRPLARSQLFNQQQVDRVSDFIERYNQIGGEGAQPMAPGFGFQ